MTNNNTRKEHSSMEVSGQHVENGFLAGYMPTTSVPQQSSGFAETASDKIDHGSLVHSNLQMNSGGFPQFHVHAMANQAGRHDNMSTHTNQSNSSLSRALDSKGNINNIGSYVERLQLSSEDIEKLANFEANHDFSNIPPLPESTFNGHEGDELFDLELPPLHSPNGTRNQRQSQNVTNKKGQNLQGTNKNHTLHQEHAARLLADMNDIDAARSLLAALGPPSGLNSDTASKFPQDTQGHFTDAGQMADFARTITEALANTGGDNRNPPFMNQQQDIHQQYHTASFSNNTPYYYVDPASGQLVQVPNYGIKDPLAHMGFGQPNHDPFHHHSTTTWDAGLYGSNSGMMHGKIESNAFGQVYNPNAFSFAFDGNGNIAGFDVNSHPNANFIPGPGFGHTEPSQPRSGFNRQNGSPRKSPTKRRRPVKAAVDADTLSRRTEQMELGFSHDEISGRILRHGPALVASTKENKELPVIKSLFDAFHNHNGFNGDPPPGYTSEMLHGKQQQNTLNMNRKSGFDSTVIPATEENFHRGPLQQDENVLLYSGNSGEPNAASKDSPLEAQNNVSDHLKESVNDEDKSIKNQMGAEKAAHDGETNQEAPPGRRQLTPSTGHGFITSLVTKELQSSTISAMNSADRSTKKGDKKSETERMLLGVIREKWSLSWDAYIKLESNDEEVEANKLIQKAKSNHSDSYKDENEVDEEEQAKRDAVHLGKFPTQEQAGRAHDIAALKFHGEKAITNFPKENYLSTIAILSEHTNEEIVAAIRKDSQLAMQRSSKYKGVRRTGSGQYEARAGAEALRAATNMPLSPSKP